MTQHSSWWLVSGLTVVLVTGSCAAAPIPGETASAVTAPETTTSTPSTTAIAPAPEGWTQVEDPPLSPRRNAYAFAFGPAVVVAGGSDAEPCPPNAACTWQEHPLADGASYDTVTDAWKSIAAAPVALGLGTSAVSGGTAYLWLWGDPPTPDWSTASFVSYDVIGDRWQVLPRPPRVPGSSFHLASVPGGVVAYAPTDEAGGPDYWYDAEQADWRELPDDPLGPSFDREMSFAAGVLVLLAPELVPQPGSERPSLLRVAVFDPRTWTWSRLADSEILSGDASWYAADDRVVNPSMTSADGGPSKPWGRSYPTGGILDPASGVWSDLPPAPPDCDCYGGFTAGSHRYLLNRQGRVLDLANGSWLPLPRPDGAPDEGQAAAWAEGGGLLVFGGNTYGSTSDQVVGAGRLFDDAWLWSPIER